MLESLRLPMQTRPGILIFAAETITLWFASQQQQYQPQRTYTRGVEILLWLAEAATTAEDKINNPAFTSFVNLLAQPPQQQNQESILATLFHYFQTFSLETKLRAMKLIGFCCQHPESSAFYACWPALEHILCSERNEEVLHITACALFESIANHAATPTFSSQNTHQNYHQLRATAALENGLACPMPSIQFAAAVAAGKVLMHQRQAQQQFWHEGLVERIATASDQAYRIQQDRLGAWGAWQPNAGGTAVPVLQVPSSRKFTAQHVLAVLEIVHNDNLPINRES